MEEIELSCLGVVLGQSQLRHWQYFPVDHALTDGEVEVEAGPPQPLLLRV